jgi:hypothetical protein
MSQYIREKGLLPGGEIERLIATTPTAPIIQADLIRLGFNNWQD